MKDVLFKKLYAEKAAHDAYLALCGRLPTTLEIEAFSAQVLATGDAVAALKQIVASGALAQKSVLGASDSVHSGAEPALTAEEHWRKTVHLHADYVIQSLYLAILGREHGREEIKSMSAKLKEKDLITVIRDFVLSREYLNIWWKKLEPEFASERRKIEEQLKKQNHVVEQLKEKQSYEATAYRRYKTEFSGINFQYSSYPYLTHKHHFALIFVPVETWAPFAMAIASYLYEKYQYQSIFVYLEWCPAIAQAASLEEAVVGSMHYDEVKDLATKAPFNPELFVTHSFGWFDHVKALLPLFPDTEIMVYADGLRNDLNAQRIHSERKIAGSFFFNYAKPESGIKVEATIRSVAVFEYIDRIAELYCLQPDRQALQNEKSDYAVVYLRYWGRGDYFEMEDADVVQSMVDTISWQIGIDTALVIKDDHRARPDLLPAVITALGQKGYQVSSFTDYLERYGINKAYSRLPVEYFYACGLLSRARAHVVFDSSMGYIIATNPHISRQTEVIVGADLSVFRHKIEQQLVGQTGKQKESELAIIVRVLGHRSDQYKDAILSTRDCGLNELIDSHDRSLFHVRLL